MQSENLLLIFVKNIRLSKVKTRLAKTIGDKAAFEVYKHLVEITEQETKLLSDKITVHVYFSEVIIDSKWPGKKKFVQEGRDLGERMKNAFKKGFEMGFKRVIGIGADLPDLKSDILLDALEILQKEQMVFGPAEDGGYYLLGMNKMVNCVFEEKPWSTPQLLQLTLAQLQAQKISYHLLPQLNDIDTIEDLKTSSLSHKFKHFYELS